MALTVGIYAAVELIASFRFMLGVNLELMVLSFVNFWLHVCCCEPSLDMYAQLTVLSFVIFCCIRMHMWTLHSCTAGYMYYLIYVCWSWSCTAGYIYLLDICAAG